MMKLQIGFYIQTAGGQRTLLAKPGRGRRLRRWGMRQYLTGDSLKTLGVAVHLGASCPPSDIGKFCLPLSYPKVWGNTAGSVPGTSCWGSRSN